MNTPFGTQGNHTLPNPFAAAFSHFANISARPQGGLGSEFMHDHTTGVVPGQASDFPLTLEGGRNSPSSLYFLFGR